MIEYPNNPIEGDNFFYICPFSGCTVVTVVYQSGEWKHLETN